MNRLSKIVNFSRFKEAFLRFPLSFVVITAAFVLMQVMQWGDFKEGPTENTLERLIATLWVTLPLFTVSALLPRKRGLSYLASAVLGAVFFAVLLPEDVWSQNAPLVIGLWGFAFYSTVFLAPVWKKDENNGFWQYVGQLFFVLVLGFFYSGVLWASAALVHFALADLFGVYINPDVPETLVQVIFFFLLPIFVHVYFPRNFAAMEKLRIYPEFLRAICFYLLNPILGVYAVILAVYLLKILVTWEWPTGHVAQPILYFAFLGLATYFLSYPWRQKWQKWFFGLLLPFLAMYFFALWQRISEFGMTEMRYLAVLVGIALALLSVYFLWVKQAKLRSLLAVFSAFAFLFSFGSWGIFEVPLASQKSRLEEILTQVSGEALSEQDQQEINQIVWFFEMRSEIPELQDLVTVDLSAAEFPAEAFLSELGLSFDLSLPPLELDPNFFQYMKDFNDSEDVSGYAELFDVDIGLDYAPTEPFTWKEQNFSFTLSLETNGDLVLKSEGRTDVRFPLLTAGEELFLDVESEGYKFRFYIEDFNGRFGVEDRLKEAYLQGRLLIGKL